MMKQEPEYVKVEGKPGWYKDVLSGTIINNNEEEINAARRRKIANKEKAAKQESLESDISDLKKEFSELKDMVKALIEKY